VKVLMITRATLFSDKGGDSVQVKNTVRYLEKLGIECDIKLANEKINYSNYDLIHFFNIIRPADILHHAKKAKKPYVVSTIYVDYREFEKQARKGITGFLFKLLPVTLIEYIKVIARSLLNDEKINSTEYLWMGHYRSVKKIIRGSALLLPNSHSEYQRLASDFKVEHKYCVIPNAIDAELFNRQNENLKKEDDLVLCVGRIEGRKNQLNLIKALNNTQYQLYIIGASAKNQREYYRQCKEAAGKNIHFIEALPQPELAGFYQRAKVHVLPSWFETTGLSSLEAAAMGCNVVITDKGDAKEYFEDMAFYCDPLFPASIKKAIDKAAGTPFNENLRNKIFAGYTWSITAQKTAEAYRTVLA
jgi:glycosyltransferase involved in cell wall biosynthesis